METHLEEIRERQKEIWNRFSPGWDKWDDFMMQFMKPMSEVIISKLTIQENDHVLDVACGTGEPGLTIALLAKNGKVVGTDLSDKMLVIADKHALQKGIINYTTSVCDVCELPYADYSFDKICCRMGFMFFPDMQLAMDEMYRVLKPNGKMSTCVWGDSQNNLWVSGIMGIINKNMSIEKPPPEAPGMFRCAPTGLMQSVMEKSGFKNIDEQEVSGIVVYDDFEHLWQMMNDVAAPIVGALSRASEELKQQIKNEVEAFAKPFQTSKGLEMTYSSLVLSGSK